MEKNILREMTEKGKKRKSKNDDEIKTILKEIRLNTDQKDSCPPRLSDLIVILFLVISLILLAIIF